jgi:hypothetical protein
VDSSEAWWLRGGMLRGSAEHGFLGRGTGNGRVWA